MLSGLNASVADIVQRYLRVAVLEDTHDHLIAAF